jgi:lipopolysaccharide transport system permease protein
VAIDPPERIALPAHRKDGPATGRPRRVVLRAGGSPIAWHDLVEFRELLVMLGKRDVTLRYRQTALGVIWVVLQPLLAAAIFTIVFGRVAGLPSDGVPYFLFAYAGFLAWNGFQGTLTRASMSLVQNTALVSKVYFPRLVLPLSTVFSTTIDFLVGLALFLVLAVARGTFPGPEILLLPLWFLLLQSLAIGIGAYAAAVTARYRDVQYALPVFIQFATYASPVAYAVSAVPGNLLRWYMLNPVTPLLDVFRWSLLGTPVTSWPHVAYAAVFALACLILGVVGFGRLERRVADVI